MLLWNQTFTNMLDISHFFQGNLLLSYLWGSGAKVPNRKDFQEGPTSKKNISKKSFILKKKKRRPYLRMGYLLALANDRLVKK